MWLLPSNTQYPVPSTQRLAPYIHELCTRQGVQSLRLSQGLCQLGRAWLVSLGCLALLKWAPPGGGVQTLWNLGRSHWATAGTRPYEVEGQAFRLKWPRRAGQLDGSECDRVVPVPLSTSGQPNLIVYNSFTMAAKQQIQLMRKQRFHQKISLGKCMKLSLFLMTTILKL